MRRSRLFQYFKVFSVSLFLASCATAPESTPVKTTDSSLPPSVAAAPERLAMAPADEAAPQERRLTFYRRVDGALTQSATEEASAAPRLQLNFVSAPVGDVARTVINDALDASLSVADGVSGRVTLTSPEPVAAPIALRALEEVLAESGLALLETPTGFVLTTLTSAEAQPQTLRTVNASGPGFAVTVAPIVYTTASDIAGLIEPFVADRVNVTPDDQNGLLFLRGPQSDVAAALEVVETFDAPWLTDRIFGLFELRHADAESLKTEIESVFRAGDGGRLKLIEFIPMPRINGLFVTTRDTGFFREAREWVERLDIPSGGTNQRLFYYAAKNTAAAELAEAINSVYTGLSATNSGAGAITAAPRSTAVPRQNNGATIVPDELNNALIIRATNAEYQELLELIERMDQPSPQVLIEATIAEVILNDDLRFGVQWFLEQGGSTLASSNSEAVSTAPQLPGLSYTYVQSGIRAALSTLASVSDVTVLSTPSILVQNNQSANLQVGDEVPIVTQQVSGSEADSLIRSTVQFRQTGVILDVKARINASDMVVLEVSQEVSDVAETVSSGIDSPTIQQRSFSSTVGVRDGQTIALGGLIRESQSDGEVGVPLIKNIPVLGYAFKTRTLTNRRTELIIFLTPRIVRDEGDVNAVMNNLKADMATLRSRLDERED